MDRKEAMRRERERLNKIMSIPKISLSDIWFIDQEHAHHFMELMDRFKVKNDEQYATACYVVATPEIYHKINWDRIEDNPVEWYFGDFDEENDEVTESEVVGALSSAYQQLARAAVECFTCSKHHFDLAAFIGNASDDTYKLFIQAMEIRRNRKIVDISEGM